MIDTTIVRSHPCVAGYKKNSQDAHALGRIKGGFTTKIHVVDALGQALRFSLTGGQRNDITQASGLLRHFKGANTIADKGYDSEKLLSQIQEQGCRAVIPPRSNRKKNLRKYDKHLYKERHLVECFFNKVKHFRRVFSRFDKKASSFMGFLAYASIILWLR